MASSLSNMSISAMLGAFAVVAHCLVCKLIMTAGFNARAMTAAGAKQVRVCALLVASMQKWLASFFIIHTVPVPESRVAVYISEFTVELMIEM